jgi:hypothetical protein
VKALVRRSLSPTKSSCPPNYPHAGGFANHDPAQFPSRRLRSAPFPSGQASEIRARMPFADGRWTGPLGVGKRAGSTLALRRAISLEVCEERRTISTSSSRRTGWARQFGTAGAARIVASIDQIERRCAVVLGLNLRVCGKARDRTPPGSTIGWCAVLNDGMTRLAFSPTPRT